MCEDVSCLEMGGFISCLVTGDQTMYRFAKDKKRKDKITSIFIGMFFLTHLKVSYLAARMKCCNG